MRPRIETLFSLVLDYDRRLLAAKRERSLLDFADLEHFAVQLLVERRDGEYCKTPLARQLSESFAFVLVDEYQDTNATQDMIFGSVSRPDNLFMVGDVKQSIYRFRQAMPEILFTSAVPTMITTGRTIRRASSCPTISAPAARLPMPSTTCFMP